MPIGTWYVALFSLGAGASIIVFWTVVLARRALTSLLPGPDATTHVVAEMLCGSLLLGGGAALLVDHDAPWASALAGIGLGAVVYALTGSIGLYPGRRAMRAAFIAGWIFALPAIVLLLISV